MRTRGMSPVHAWLMALLLLAETGRAQAAAKLTCQAKCTFDQKLWQPHEIKAARGRLVTALQVKMRDACVPEWISTTTNNTTTWSCTMTPMSLPSYRYSDRKGNFIDGHPGRSGPGPTLRVRKAENEAGEGDRIMLRLVNALPPELHPNECLACEGCSGTTPPQCCLLPTVPNPFPDCFHGVNSTNLHLHGAHVSPQAPQDDVLLELRPKGSSLATGDHAHGRGTIAVGEFRFRFDPLRWTQPEGTYWYHPHKHGSTAAQVGEGMAGALIIEGQFDDWLQHYYAGTKGGLQEKLLVVQQIHLLNMLIPNAAPASVPQPLINGQTSPRIEMCPGEIQRWRFVGATMEGSAQIVIQFNGQGALFTSANGIAEVSDSSTAAIPECDKTGVCAKQIAMDGVQFAPENYGSQPLVPQLAQYFSLSPGNRADFLVRAPSKPGKYHVTYDVFGSIDGSKRRRLLRSLLQSARAGSKAETEAGTIPPGRLLTLEVKNRPGCPGEMTFPTESEWPRMPKYLRDVADEEIGLPDRPRRRELWFDLKNFTGGAATTPAQPATQPAKFYINLNPNENRQFDPNCVDITTTLNTAEEWTIHNTTRTVSGSVATPTPANPAPATPFHDFHIHTNHYQVIELAGLKEATSANVPPSTPDNCERKHFKYPIWQDSTTLPSACYAIDNEGTSVLEPGHVKIRLRFEDFTGEYVLHCHFLGHEDLGMMLAVQTICKETADHKEHFGAARPAGPECVPGNYVPAAPRCKPVLTSAPSSSDGQ
jgi:FtsP/CotA-like multicopper oxidase with cupredoxin domain